MTDRITEQETPEDARREIHHFLNTTKQAVLEAQRGYDTPLVAEGSPFTGRMFENMIDHSGSLMAVVQVERGSQMQRNNVERNYPSRIEGIGPEDRKLIVGLLEYAVAEGILDGRQGEPVHLGGVVSRIPQLFSILPIPEAKKFNILGDLLLQGTGAMHEVIREKRRAKK